MAEMASISPTSGGQYHWASEFGGRSYQKFLSYATGWLSVLGWQAAFASVCFLCGTLMQSLIQLNQPGYAAERWHGTLFTAAIALATTFINTHMASHLPSLEGLILILHVFGFFATMIPLWVMAERTPTKDVFTQFTNTAGWPTLGLACLVGQISPIFSFLGPDAATHIAEEIKDASKVVPWCMISTALINGSLGFIMLITYLFTMGDLHEVIKAESGFSFITAFLNATGSKAATTSLGSLLVVMEACAAISVLATVSRQTFAFARDNALPFSQFFARVHPKSKVPVNSILASTVITILLSLINIGSTEAFNAIASLTIASLFMSYLVCIGCFIYRRLQWKEIPPARFSLGACGLPVNIISFLYLSFAIVFTFFPNNNYPTAVSMNWSVLVFGVVVIFAGLQYLIHGRKVYDGPVAYVDKIE
ncbi:amino acid permease [Histoplasma capsulatum G186AR]|uniref:Amino acid permease n=2 Tax=Ajellomyces capsulatus TaxID=5037 RepID=C0NH18_AJECG|nr:amino acid permease [Histoplasma capsulatum G186AR]EEH09103.1 amino acid permease [Histoplasma capsulatum G186AR]